MSDNPEDLFEQGETKLEKKFNRVLTPFEEFIHDETAGGIVLMVCTVIALVLANSPLAGAYQHILHTPIAFSVGDWTLEHTLHHWINDGLMALFFFLVGLEIKREVLVGELARPQQAMLPIIAALGGMIVPALFYTAVNAGGPAAHGWGIPMATDIAFAVGIMVLLGKRVPPSLFTFLVALAIVDDLGAVAVIAVFYTETLVYDALFAALAMLGLLVFLNLLGVRKPLPYAIVGILMWLAMLKSGVHATVAGVLTAWTIPAKSKFNPETFARLMQKLVSRYNEARAKTRAGDQACMIADQQHRRGIVQSLENGVHLMETPLQRLEHMYHLPVAFIIIPLFALANAGIPIEFSKIGEAVAHPAALGVILGLVLGKVIGIAGCALLAVKLGFGQMPQGANAKHIIGAGLLGGVGFTMSIFIAELGFPGHPELLLMAKTGILFASLIAGVAGYLFLRSVATPTR
ncbi:MAG: Na+/H+ antiporter NhaA [Gammaproteobacteria bacterium]